jgi:hypothetical protein
MRGCLGFALILVAALAALVIVAANVVAPALVSATVRGSSFFHGQPVSVEVQTSLAGLLRGEVDRISITGGPLREGSATVGLVQIAVTDVGILNHAFGAVDGTLEGVVVDTAEGIPLRFEQVTLSGSSGSMTAVGRISAADLEAALLPHLGGVQATRVSVSNGRIDVEIAGRTAEGRLLVVGRTVVLDAGPLLGQLTILEAPADGSWRVTAIGLDAAGAVITAAISGSAFGPP